MFVLSHCDIFVTMEESLLEAVVTGSSAGHLHLFVTHLECGAVMTIFSQCGVKTCCAMLTLRVFMNTPQAIGFMKGMVKSLDTTLVKHVDEDSFFENQKAFIFHYIRAINDAQKASVQKVKHRQGMVAAFQKVGVALVHLVRLLPVVSDCCIVHDPLRAPSFDYEWSEMSSKTYTSHKEQHRTYVHFCKITHRYERRTLSRRHCLMRIIVNYPWKRNPSPVCFIESSHIPMVFDLIAILHIQQIARSRFLLIVLLLFSGFPSPYLGDGFVTVHTAQWDYQGYAYLK